MAKTIVIVGYGPGISNAVAERFGREGFAAALVARNADRLAEGARALEAKGIKAASFPADAGNPAAIRAAIAKARTALGPVGVLHWNAISGLGVGDLLKSDPASLRGVFDVAITGLLAAVQEVLPDLRHATGAVLVTNGAFGENTPQMDALGVGLKTEGVALANAAKLKLVGLLSEALKPHGIYVGEVMVAGMVKGTAWDTGSGGIESTRIADTFWKLYQNRKEVRARVA